MVTQIKNEAREKSEPLYETIQALLCEEIESGKLLPGQRIDSPTILAKKWNVSPATVQQSLQMLATKGIVIRKPRSGTYVNPEGGNTGMSKTSNGISLLLPDIQAPEYAFLSRAIQDRAYEEGLDVMVGSTDNQVERYNQMILRQISGGTYGMIMVPPIEARLPLETLLAIQEDNIPVVACYRAIDAMNWPMVCYDSYHSVYLTARHLGEIGRKKIAFLGYAYCQNDYSIMHYAFLRTLLEMSVGVDPDCHLAVGGKINMFQKPASHLLVYEQIKEWLAHHEEVDGICCCHDEIAAMVLDILRRKGRRTPEDVAVTGIGNLGQYFGFSCFDLTTVEGFAKLADELFKKLQLMREGKLSEDSMISKVKGELIVRCSTVGGSASGQ